jgi:hypothetical protein
MGVCLSTYCIATAVLVLRFEVCAQQRVCTPQYENTDRGSAEDTGVAPNLNAPDDGRVARNM